MSTDLTAHSRIARLAGHSGTRRFIIALLVVLGIAATFRIFGQASAIPPAVVSTPAALELLPQDVAEATVQDLQRTIPLSGAIQPLHQTEIKSQQAGEIREVLLREGEPVRRGQIVARLDTAELEAKLRDKLGALAVGKAQLSLAEKNLRANASLLEDKFISQNAYDSVQSSYQINQATLASLEAQVEQARKAVADAVIRSPLDGVVAERIAQPGLAVAVNAKLFTVQDLSLMSVEAPVPASDIPQVEVGQEARFLIEGFAERVFVGKVDRINPSTEKGSRSIMVHLLVENADSKLKGGMFAQGMLGVSSVTSAIVVPRTAVREQDGRTTIFRIDAGVLLEQPVETGAHDAANDVIEIKSGLAPGAQVVVVNQERLHSGQPVRIANIQSGPRP